MRGSKDEKKIFANKASAQDWKNIQKSAQLKVLFRTYTNICLCTIRYMKNNTVQCMDVDDIYKTLNTENNVHRWKVS